MLLADQLAPAMGPDKDTWLVSRICGTFKERRKHSPNQLPLPVIERIVLACSNPGDSVLDPFAGAGTVGVVARKLGREYRGYELVAETAKAANKRILATPKGRR